MGTQFCKDGSYERLSCRCAPAAFVASSRCSCVILAHVGDPHWLRASSLALDCGVVAYSHRRPYPGGWFGDHGEPGSLLLGDRPDAAAVCSQDWMPAARPLHTNRRATPDSGAACVHLQGGAA